MSPKPHARFYSSPLSEFCAEELPGDFHYLDGDEILLRHSAMAICYARSTTTLRIIESKHPGEELRRSQRETFPLLAEAIARSELLSRESGVFVLEGDPPYNGGRIPVAKVRPAHRNRVNGFRFEWIRAGDATSINALIRCRPVTGLLL